MMNHTVWIFYRADKIKWQRRGKPVIYGNEKWRINMFSIERFAWASENSPPTGHFANQDEKKYVHWIRIGTNLQQCSHLGATIESNVKLKQLNNSRDNGCQFHIEYTEYSQRIMKCYCTWCEEERSINKIDRERFSENRFKWITKLERFFLFNFIRLFVTRAQPSPLFSFNGQQKANLAAIGVWIQAIVSINLLVRFNDCKYMHVTGRRLRIGFWLPNNRM